MIHSSKRLLLGACAAVLPLAFSPTATAGVGGKVFDVDLQIGGENPTECTGAELDFGNESGGFRGDCGVYVGGWSEFDLFFIGWWSLEFDIEVSEGADRFAYGDVPCTERIVARGIHFFGGVVYGGGQFECNPFSLGGFYKEDSNIGFGADAAPFARDNSDVRAMYLARS